MDSFQSIHLNPVASVFKRLPGAGEKITQMVNGGLLFDFFVIEFTSGTNMFHEYIVLKDVLSLSKLLQDHPQKMFQKGSNRLLMHNLMNHKRTLYKELTRFMLVSKMWHNKINPFMKLFKQTNYLSIWQSAIYDDNILRFKCILPECHNVISSSDAELNHLMNCVRNDGDYYGKCAECDGFKIYREGGKVSAHNYAQCHDLRCKKIFYIAFDYNGCAAICPSCRYF